MNAKREKIELLVLLASIVLLPAAVRVNVPARPSHADYGDGRKPKGAPCFDEAPVRELQVVRPDYVFIGNSNTYTRVEPGLLERLTGKKVLVMASAGTFGVHWYLQVKNHVAASGVAPERVFIFFRDGELLGFSSRVGDDIRYRFSKEFEPAFAAIHERGCTTAGSELRAKATRLLTLLWPLAGVRTDALRNVALDMLPGRVLAGRDTKEFRKQLNARTGLGHLRHAAGRAVFERLEDPGERRGFQHALQCSVLSFMLEEASRAGFELFFVRLQPRSYMPGDRKREHRAADLARWLKSNGAGYLDLCGDPGIRPYWYGSQDHIAPRYMKAWTTLFYERVFKGSGS